MRDEQHRTNQDRELTYEGRALARPDEEVMDQDLGFDVLTLLSRRQVLRGFALGATAISQVALPQDACDAVYATDGDESSVSSLSQVSLDSDGVFGDDRAAAQLGTVTSGYAVSLALGVDTSTTPTGGRLSGDGAPSGARLQIDNLGLTEAPAST